MSNLVPSQSGTAVITDQMNNFLSPEVREAFGRERLNVARNMIGPWMTPAQFGLFLEICQTRGLSPWDKEIYPMPAKKRLPNGKEIDSIECIIGIDAFRRRAFANPRYEGFIGPLFPIMEGKKVVDWVDYWFSQEPPMGAKFGVHVKGLKDIVWATVSYREMSRNTGQWPKMQSHMIGIRAETHCWRRAFPAEMGGLYTQDEIDSSEFDGSITVTTSTEPKPSRPPLPAPAPTAPAGAEPQQSQTPGPNPDEAKRKVLMVSIKSFMKDLDQGDAERVRATVASMTNPGPYAQKWPAFDKWTADQMEELIRLYEDLEDAARAAAEQAEDEAQEAEVTPTESAPEQSEETAAAELADELAPKPSETDENGKPKAPF